MAPLPSENENSGGGDRTKSDVEDSQLIDSALRRVTASLFVLSQANPYTTMAYGTQLSGPLATHYLFSVEPATQKSKKTDCRHLSQVGSRSNLCFPEITAG
jgi:hypothetical protein